MNDKEIELTNKLKQLQEMVIECNKLAQQTYGKKAFLFVEANHQALHVCYDAGVNAQDEILLDPKIWLPLDFGWFFE